MSMLTPCFVIFSTRKESFQARQHQDQAGEAKRALSAKRSTIKYDDVEDIFGDDTVNVSMEMDEIEEFGELLHFIILKNS